MNMENTRLQGLQDRLNRYSEAVGPMIIGKNEAGYYITYKSSQMVMTSGRNIEELAAYIDGLRDMLFITMTKGLGLWTKMIES